MSSQWATENDCLYTYYQGFYYAACESDRTSLEVTMRLALLGILHKIDKQLALLCFGMFVIKREIGLF